MLLHTWTAQAKSPDHTLKSRTQNNYLVVHKTVIILTLKLKQLPQCLGSGCYFWSMPAFTTCFKVLGPWYSASTSAHHGFSQTQAKNSGRHTDTSLHAYRVFLLLSYISKTQTERKMKEPVPYLLRGRATWSCCPFISGTGDSITTHQRDESSLHLPHQNHQDYLGLLLARLSSALRLLYPNLILIPQNQDFQVYNSIGAKPKEHSFEKCLNLPYPIESHF